MKNTILLFVFVSFFSCKKETNTALQISETAKDTIKISPKEVKALHIDTLMITSSATTNCVDKVLISTIKKEINKDSIVKATIRFDFYDKNKLVKSFPSTIEYGQEEGEWYLNQNIFSTAKNEDAFIQLSNGYPACGYVQTNFLFFIGTNDIQLITINETMSDSGYGTYTTYEPHYQNNKLVAFSSKVVNVDSDESKPSSDDDLVISYSDSVVYKWKTNKWIEKFKSEKGKTFRKEFKKFDDYHKIRE